jgi:nitrite reductase/ring-hydroxylating ferredoxin subunit
VQFPPEAYTQGDQFQREKATLFAREWLLLAARGQLAAPGRFVSHTVGGWPLFAIAGEDGAVRAFRNQCRHQQMPVVEKAEGECAELRCRFHGWTYDLAGRFVSAPPLVAPADPDAARNGLDPVGVLLADGLVLIRIDQGGVTEVPSIPLEGRRFSGAVTSDAGANWKAAAEALIEQGWRLVWPLALVRDEGGARIVRQLVPRSFLRTRLVDLVFGDGPPLPLERVGEAARADARAAELRQARLAEGAAVPASAAVAAFRERVAAAAPPG